MIAVESEPGVIAPDAVAAMAPVPAPAAVPPPTPAMQPLRNTVAASVHHSTSLSVEGGVIVILVEGR